jgi:hypothetical protein
VTPPNPQPCRWCGAEHGPLCPFVKALDFHADGVTIRRVEFVMPADVGAPEKAAPAPEPEEPQPEYPRKKPVENRADAGRPETGDHSGS